MQYGRAGKGRLAQFIVGHRNGGQQHRCTDSGTCGLGESLFGSKALGQKTGRISRPGKFIQFCGSQHASGYPLTVARQQLLETRHLGQIGSDTDNHAAL